MIAPIGPNGSARNLRPPDERIVAYAERAGRRARDRL